MYTRNRFCLILRSLPSWSSTLARSAWVVRGTQPLLSASSLRRSVHCTLYRCRTKYFKSSCSDPFLDYEVSTTCRLNRTSIRFLACVVIFFKHVFYVTYILSTSNSNMIFGCRSRWQKLRISNTFFRLPLAGGFFFLVGSSPNNMRK